MWPRNEKKILTRRVLVAENRQRSYDSDSGCVHGYKDHSLQCDKKEENLDSQRYFIFPSFSQLKNLKLKFIG